MRTSASNTYHATMHSAQPLQADQTGSARVPGMRADHDRPHRGHRLQASVIDAALGLGLVVLGSLIAFGWLLAVTGIGQQEPGALHNSVAFAIVLAAIPAWYGVLATGSLATPTSRTPGQSRAGLLVIGTPRRRLLRLSVHPLSAIGWWWLAGVSALATLPVLPLLLAAAGTIALLGGGVSLALLTVRPESRALHDRIAGTEIVRAVVRTEGIAA